MTGAENLKIDKESCQLKNKNALATSNFSSVISHIHLSGGSSYSFYVSYSCINRSSYHLLHHHSFYVRSTTSICIGIHVFSFLCLFFFFLSTLFFLVVRLDCVLHWMGMLHALISFHHIPYN